MPESNGKRPDPIADEPSAPSEQAEPLDRREPGSELEVAFTPRQILGGFALLAALILLLRRRRRRDSGPDR